jgi:RNA polymerase sigma factor (sigma-70 family)
VLRQLQDHTILTAIAAGDERAFSSLFHEYHQPLGVVVFSVTRSNDLTQEIIQDVFIKVWENRKALPGIHNFSAYLFIITRNHTLNAIRKQQLVLKKQQAVSSNLAIDEVPVREENYYDLLDTAVDRLPLQQKKVYLLKQQGLKNTDVALQLNISVNSVKKYQQWALQAITRFIKAGPFTGLFFFLIELF